MLLGFLQLFELPLLALLFDVEAVVERFVGFVVGFVVVALVELLGHQQLVEIVKVVIVLEYGQAASGFRLWALLFVASRRRHTPNVLPRELSLILASPQRGYILDALLNFLLDHRVLAFSVGLHLALVEEDLEVLILDLVLLFEVKVLDVAGAVVHSDLIHRLHLGLILCSSRPSRLNRFVPNMRQFKLVAVSDHPGLVLLHLEMVDILHLLLFLLFEADFELVQVVGDQELTLRHQILLQLRPPDNILEQLGCLLVLLLLLDLFDRQLWLVQLDHARLLDRRRFLNFEVQRIYPVFIILNEVPQEV